MEGREGIKKFIPAELQEGVALNLASIHWLNLAVVVVYRVYAVGDCSWLWVAYPRVVCQHPFSLRIMANHDSIKACPTCRP